ncbi:hypothetical protein RND71_006073 [Anisodus tanguticus]|uniref:Uncharacterized protein n=1 Tax=Anisodus tanguticus TaxID=243964 RepID=A0AAE1SVF0_9SOLA|nr:hypothetical protein RND71_006073 [Anisodus tanguticus]
MKLACVLRDISGLDLRVAEALKNKRMKLEKDEERRMDPLFPRLHINDVDKGSPRAPPRNKMALCEQSSRSPQRLTSTSTPAPGTMSMLPLPPNDGNSIHAASSSLVSTEFSVFFLYK